MTQTAYSEMNSRDFCRSADPNSHVAITGRIQRPTAIVAIGIDGASVKGKATKAAVEASAVKLAAAMEGERTSHTVPTHTAAESRTAESAAHTVCTRSTSGRAHSTSVRAHSTPVPAHTTTLPPPPPVSPTTAVSATPAVSAATAATTTATGECNSWGKGDRCTDYGGDSNGHEALSKHGSVSSRWRATPIDLILATAAYVTLNADLREAECIQAHLTVRPTRPRRRGHRMIAKLKRREFIT